MLSWEKKRGREEKEEDEDEDKDEEEDEEEEEKDRLATSRTWAVRGLGARETARQVGSFC